MIERRFTPNNSTIQNVFYDIKWRTTDAIIKDIDGNIRFEQKQVEFPEFFSDRAVNIVSEKYFKVINGVRENSLKQIISRVVLTISKWGMDNGYFSNIEEQNTFEAELAYILVHQYACFNSPVWFNVGVPGRSQQISACFLTDVEDTMESILQHGVTEGLIFKGGSGSGVNVSKLRAEGEPMSTGGTSSGPLSFMKGWDHMAGAIKSGGSTRRAAKMVLMDAEHPDVWKFVDSKVIEERKARALVDAGYNDSIDGEAYGAVAYQNENHSVSVDNNFMRRAIENRIYKNIWRTIDGEFAKEFRADDLLTNIAYAAWQCGDPGLWFRDTINLYNTVANDGDIITCNPCGEFNHLPFTSCNLSSINLLKFVSLETPEWNFDFDIFSHVVSMMTIAQDISISGGEFPTEQIAEQTRKYRPIGIGFTNLGGLLMAKGIPYDSDNGREEASIISAWMTGTAYLTSAWLAERVGPFERYEYNVKPMTQVLNLHTKLVKELDIHQLSELWREVLRSKSFRNSYVTNIAPVGTISFFMDSDTTGIEPEISLIRTKKMVGGGYERVDNELVIKGMNSLGYDTLAAKGLIDYYAHFNTVEGYDDNEEINKLFLTALPDSKGNALSPEAHIKMVAAVQPHISGGISKTVNCPESYTSQDIKDLYLLAWNLGCKAISVYRDNSKVSQPMSSHNIDIKVKSPEVSIGVRRHLPIEPVGPSRRLKLGNVETYVHVDEFEDGTPGAVFCTTMPEHSSIDGFMEVIAILTSYALQYGVPLEKLTQKLRNVKFEPSGFTGDSLIPSAPSLPALLFRYLEKKYVDTDRATDNVALDSDNSNDIHIIDNSSSNSSTGVAFCNSCGSITQQTGNCYFCPNCGETGGCE